MTKPEISIIVTNYNYSQYLEQCIRSCVEQRTRIDYEVIIVDDGSTDCSVDLVKPYLSKPVRLIAIENSGIEIASNTGIASAEGDLIVRLDADDYLLPHYLEVMVPRMKDWDCAFLYSDYYVVDALGHTLYEEKLPPFDKVEIYGRGDFLATGTVYRKAVIEEFGLYDAAIKNCGLENYYLILKMLRASHIGLHVSEALFAYRRHSLNVSVTKRDAIVDHGRAMFQELGLGAFRTNEFHPYRLVIP